MGWLFNFVNFHGIFPVLLQNHIYGIWLSVNELSTLGGVVLYSILKIPCFHLPFTLAHTHTIWKCILPHYSHTHTHIPHPGFFFFQLHWLSFPGHTVFMGNTIGVYGIVFLMTFFF